MRTRSFSRSPVDILIPFHGQHDHVAKLVESILLITKSNPYQICLIDDCSPNEKFIVDMFDVPQVITVRNEEQLGFAGAVEAGFEATEQPWVCIMHSDVVVKDPNWLVELGRSLQRWKESGEPVKMVSAKSNRPGSNGLLKSPPKAISEDRVLGADDGFLPFYCTMCHRDLFHHIDGFLKRYPYAWYEDQEIAYRMRAYGFLQGVCGKSWVQHYEGKTINTLLAQKPELKEIMDENRTRCIRDMKLLVE